MDGLRRNPRITAVTADVTAVLLDTELNDTWGVNRIGAGAVHDTGNRGAAVKVAVIDSGINYDHPDLVANYAGGYDFVNQDGDPFDDNGHGTHVAGTIAASDNGTGVVGAAPDASIYALKAFDATGSASFSDIIAALEWAVDHGMDVVNNSYGSSEDPGPIVELAYQNAEAAGLLLIGSAGNSGTCIETEDNVLYPARFDTIVAVGATDWTDARPCFSSTGPDVELAAPGVFINSTLVTGGYGWMNGTSMAAPHVSGTAGLILRAGVPDTNGNGRINDEIRTALTTTTLDLGATGRDTAFGFGLVDAAAAVATAGPPAPGIVVKAMTDKTTYLVDTDTSAVLTAVVTAEDFSPVSGLSSGAFLTMLDGSVAVFATPFVESVTAGTYTAMLDIETVAEGPHVVDVTVDAQGLSHTGTTAFIKALEPPTEPLAGVQANGTASEAGQVSASFDVTLNQPARQTLTVNYTVTGSATPDADYTALPGSVVIAEGSASASIAVDPIDDPDVENDETVTLILTAGTGYSLGSAIIATVSITSDDDPADLVVSSASAPASGAASDTFDVSETTANQGTGPAAASTTTIYLSADFAVDPTDVVLGSRAIPALDGGAESVGTTTVVVPPGTLGGRYRLIVRANADDTAAESTTTNNNAWLTIDIGPDLVVTSFDAPATGSAGETLVVTDTTENQGEGPAAASMTRYYLSTNALWDAGDQLLGSRSIGVLGPQALSSGSISVSIPPATSAGAYYLLAVADGGEVVPETVETNNAKFSSFRIGADLVVSTFSAPSMAGAGETIALSDTTENRGGGSAGPSTTRLYLSDDVTLDAGDAALGGRPVPSLAAGASSSGSTDVTIPAQTASGLYYLLAIADADDAVPETAESNNKAFRTLQIGADLVISALTAPSSAGAGDTIDVTDTTTNQGTSAAGSSVTRFYLSGDFVFDPGDAVLGERPVSGLTPGGAESLTTALTIPLGTPNGSYQIIAVADADDAIVETVEGNNTRFRTVKVGSDLVVSALTGPSTAGAGTSISVTDTTTNQGGGQAGASTTSFYLSQNFTLDGQDVALGSRGVPVLGSGASHTATSSLTIPAETVSGNYYLLAQADGGGVIAETSETNNIRFWNIKVGADLVVAIASAPGSAGAGVTITVGDTTRNRGTSAAGASTTRFFLSTNVALDAGDMVLGERMVGALAPGASETGSAAVTIPSGIPAATYFLIAQADADNVVVETLDGNNTAFRTIQIGPDLTVPFVISPWTATAGSTIAITDRTSNLGGEPAGASTTALYLSSNVFLDGGDVRLGTRAVPAVASGGWHQGTTQVTLPTGLSTGLYYLIVQADADGVVDETLETNNLRLRLVRVSGGS